MPSTMGRTIDSSSRRLVKCVACNVVVMDMEHHRREFHSQFHAPPIKKTVYSSSTNSTINLVQQIQGRRREKLKKGREEEPRWFDFVDETGNTSELRKELNSGKCKCVYCEEDFASIKETVAHEKRHISTTTSSTIECLQCGEKFINSELLELHLQLLHKNYHCLHCGKSESTKQLILTHLQACPSHSNS